MNQGDMNTGRPPVVVITGPTATGKTRASLAVAHAFEDREIPAAIVSMDSVQVYRYMDVGTDKLPPEKREGIPHHLIDIIDPDRTFSAAEFAARAGAIIDANLSRGVATVVAGGTGFYLRALLWGLFPGPGAEPEVRDRLYRLIKEQGPAALHRRLAEVDGEAARRIHQNDHVRIVRALEVYEVTGEPISKHFARQRRQGPRYNALIIGLSMDREQMYGRINARVVEMMGEGLVEEVKGLRRMGYGPELASQRALGYKQVHMLLDGIVDAERSVYLIQRDTRHYARRQLTWLTKEAGLEWMPVTDLAAVVGRALSFMEEPTG